MVDWGMTLAPTSVKITFKVSPVTVFLHSIYLADDGENYSGLADWVYSLTRTLSPEEREMLSLVCMNLDEDYLFEYLEAGFPQFLEDLGKQSATEFIQKTYAWMAEKPFFTSFEQLLGNEDAYIAFMTAVYQEHDSTRHVNEPIWRKNFALLQTPEVLQKKVIQFLTMLWERFIRTEWKRVEATLNDSVTAFSQISYANMATADIVEFITNRDMRGKDYFEERMNNATHLICVPSPHLGPYLSWFHCKKLQEDILIFGARLPRNTALKSATLNRAELLVRLNALADETRLRVLEMLTQSEEVCAQDFITTLDLSQSSASRHLRQLTASGYITERRRDVAKCYTLNRERIKDTIRALSQFLD